MCAARGGAERQAMPLLRVHAWVARRRVFRCCDADAGSRLGEARIGPSRAHYGSHIRTDRRPNPHDAHRGPRRQWCHGVVRACRHARKARRPQRNRDAATLGGSDAWLSIALQYRCEAALALAGLHGARPFHRGGCGGNAEREHWRDVCGSLCWWREWCAGRTRPDIARGALARGLRHLIRRRSVRDACRAHHRWTRQVQGRACRPQASLC
mmetsp:Transcript_29440/g.90240  ORF Transcript_29440/g.90240 Transcript_29440/m.90240 type:complete len:211 (-) Transcript_29440:1787-2419(-)